MRDGLTLIGKSRRAIRHQSLALRGANCGAEIGFAREAAFALAAFRRVKRDHVIAGFDALNAGADLDNNARAFMAENAGKHAFAIQAVQRVSVGVADAGGFDLDQNFTELRAFKIKLDNFEWLLGFKCDGGASFHGNVSLEVLSRDAALGAQAP